MNSMKMKILDEILSHLDDSQGSELKSLLDESKKPMEDPEGLKIQSVEVMKPEGEEEELADADQPQTVGSKIGYPGFPKPPKKEKPTAMLGSEISDEPEMNDDELEELLRKHL